MSFLQFILAAFLQSMFLFTDFPTRGFTKNYKTAIGIGQTRFLCRNKGRFTLLYERILLYCVKYSKDAILS
jgi:hypothetical protein